MGFTYTKLDRFFNWIFFGDEYFQTKSIETIIKYKNLITKLSEANQNKLSTYNILLPLKFKRLDLTKKQDFASGSGSIAVAHNNILIMDRLGRIFLFDGSEVKKTESTK